MPETTPATVPAQPESNPPLKKGFPVVVLLVGFIVLFGVANIFGLLNGKKGAPKSALPMRPAAVSPQQLQSFEKMQAMQARRDGEDRTRQAQVAAGMQGFSGDGAAEVPGPEADSATPMTAAQRQAIYGDSPNAPQRTSNTSQAHAEAAQRELAREKERQDALNSDTVAIDFARQAETPAAAAATQQPATAVLGESQQANTQANGEDFAAPQGRMGQDGRQGRQGVQSVADQRGSSKTDPMAPYPFDDYQGQLYRVFEGTVLEGIVTNHIDGGFSGPILVMLTTDVYSHDHQQLLMPQGTRLIGNVQSVSGQNQRKLFVTFHRAVCPDGFSLDFDRFLGLDPIGTTGLASKVNNHYLSSFAAAAALGGLGGLAQIGNTASVLSPSTEVRDGLSEQTAQEGEQILDRFLNRLPTITLKEGSRARVYIGRDILIPSYAEHRVDPAL